MNPVLDRRAAIAVLEANGFEVIIPPQNCCGLPLLSNGEFSAARRYHRSNINHLIEYARQGIPIVGTSTSCTLTLKEEAPELLDMHDEDTWLVAEHVYDFNEFILLLLDQGSLNLNLQAISLTLPYHAPCQYRAHRLGRPAVEVMSLIPKLDIQESHLPCCGIAGTYGYKEEKYQIAMQVGKTLFDFVSQKHAPLAVCDSETCRWQITHGTGIPAIHPVELLAAAYGFQVEEPFRNNTECDFPGLCHRLLVERAHVVLDGESPCLELLDKLFAIHAQLFGQLVDPDFRHLFPQDPLDS